MKSNKRLFIENHIVRDEHVYKILRTTRELYNDKLEKELLEAIEKDVRQCVVTEDHGNHKVTWGISFGGSNPEANDWLEMPNAEMAFKVHKFINERSNPKP